MSPSPLRVSAVSVSSKSQKNPILESGELCVGGEQYRLLAGRDGSLHQSFPHPIEIFSSQKVKLRLTYAKRRRILPPWKTKTIKINTQPLFVTAQGGHPQEQPSVTQDEVELTFFGQEHVPASPGANVTTLLPTTNAVLDECGRFRVLVVGKTGVGKSTLINKAFGINKAHASDLERGKADITEEIMSPANLRFVLHDSLGFEPGEDDKLAIVQQFVRKRQDGPPQGRLHAVWYTTELPRAGGRVLEAAMEYFCKSKDEILGDVPMIVVFTKYDALFNELLIPKIQAHPGHNDKALRTLAQREADVIVPGYASRINEFSGQTLPTAVVSTKPGYEDTLVKLVNLTEELVSGKTSIVVSMAQRVDPTLKIRGCLYVGKQRYWKALSTSPDFVGHTIWDCLEVIHKDIIAVWNLYDPKCYLTSDEFMKLVVESVQDVQVRDILKPSGMIYLSGSALVAAISGFVSALANPAAPIVLPIIVGVAATAWLYLTYRHASNVQQQFIAYIVDLTHVMEILFVLLAGHHERLTRRAINYALQFYFQSDLRSQAHRKIGKYREMQGRDAALELIESLIIPEQGTGSLTDYYAAIGKMNLQTLRLDDDREDWVKTVHAPLNGVSSVEAHASTSR